MVGAERAGEFIEKYELLRPVAQGGMGSVWAAKLHGPHGFQKLVAMKTVLPELADDPEGRPRVLPDACAGLHAAHELTNADGESFGLVHRDVSPHNMLVSTDGSAKLIDFGVAKSRFRAASDSSVGQ